MPQIVAIGYIAITVSDLEATCTFYDELFGVRTHLERIAEGKVQVRQIALDGVASQPSPSGQRRCLGRQAAENRSRGHLPAVGRPAWKVRPSCCAGTTTLALPPSQSVSRREFVICGSSAALPFRPRFR